MIATDVRPALLLWIVCVAVPFIGGVSVPAQIHAQSALTRPTFEAAFIRLDIRSDKAGEPGGISPGRIGLTQVTGTGPCLRPDSSKEQSSVAALQGRRLHADGPE
jgi:hypothetical protein